MLSQKDRTCKKLTNCLDGEIVVYKGGAQTDRKCLPCPANSYSIGNNQFSCIPFDTCGPGLMTDTKGSSKNNRTCKACPSGKTSIKPHNETCPELEPPTSCTCKNGAPVGRCKNKQENCKICNTGFVLINEGKINRCITIEENLSLIHI